MDSWGVRLTWFDCNIFDGVGGQLFFQFIYLSIFFFLRFHFPDLTFLKLFLLSFCLVLKTLLLQLSFSSLSYFVSKGRDARNVNKVGTPVDVPFFYALRNLETSLTQVTWY